MNTTSRITGHPTSECPQYALCRDSGVWHLTLEGRPASFKHELGALYVAYLVLNPPQEPLHAVALALKAREKSGQAAGPDEAREEQSMRLEDAATVRGLWRRQRELERVLADRLEIEPVKAEALHELEEVTEYLRQSPWLSHHGAERCVRAVTAALKRFHEHLAEAVDDEGRPDAVLRRFAQHLREHVLIPSGQWGGRLGALLASVLAGSFTYEAPEGVVWHSTLRSEVQSLKSEPTGPEEQGQGRDAFRRVPNHFRQSQGRGGMRACQVVCAWLALGWLVSGCAGARPLRGGKAVMAHNAAGAVEQSLLQGENPSQASRQEQESIKVRTYAMPGGYGELRGAKREGQTREDREQKAESREQKAGSPVSQLSTFSYPLLLTEREESRTRTELGAAQKDTARELGAKLSSLRGIVWVGAGLFVFGLASLVWPPLKVIIGSVTTSAALMLGGVALAVGGWFLAHRHGELRGEVSTLKSQV